MPRHALHPFLVVGTQHDCSVASSARRHAPVCVCVCVFVCVGACIAATAHHPILHARALVLHALSTNTPIPDTAAQTLTDSCHTMLLAPHPPISHSAALSNVLTADTALVSAASIVLVPPPMQTGVQRDGDEGTDSSDSSMGTRDSVQTAGSVSLQGGQQEQGSMQCWDAASGADSQRQWMGRCETAAAALTQALQSLPAGSRGRCLPRPDATLQCVLQLWQQCQLLCLQAGMVAMEGAGRAIVQCAMGGSVSSHIAGVAACLPCGSVPWVYGEQRQHWPRSLTEAWGVETVCVPEVQQLSQDMQRIRYVRRHTHAPTLHMHADIPRLCAFAVCI